MAQIQSVPEPAALPWRTGLRFGSFVAFQFSSQRRYDLMDGLDVLDQEPLREAVDPGGLQAHGSLEGLFSLVRQNDELRPPVMRVGLECDKSFPMQVVDDPLHVLAIGAEVASEPCLLYTSDAADE